MTREQMLDRAVRECMRPVPGVPVTLWEFEDLGTVATHQMRYIRARFTQIAAIESMKEKAA